jgi:hypothetical protein
MVSEPLTLRGQLTYAHRMTVHCAASDCHHMVWLDQDALTALADRFGWDVPNTEVLRRFRCSRCGSRKVSTSWHWNGLPRAN